MPVRLGQLTVVRTRCCFLFSSEAFIRTRFLGSFPRRYKQDECQPFSSLDFGGHAPSPRLRDFATTLARSKVCLLFTVNAENLVQQGDLIAHASCKGSVECRTERQRREGMLRICGGVQR